MAEQRQDEANAKNGGPQGSKENNANPDMTNRNRKTKGCRTCMFFRETVLHCLH